MLLLKNCKFFFFFLGLVSFRNTHRRVVMSRQSRCVIELRITRASVHAEAAWSGERVAVRTPPPLECFLGTKSNVPKPEPARP